MSEETKDTTTVDAPVEEAKDNAISDGSVEETKDTANVKKTDDLDERDSKPPEKEEGLFPDIEGVAKEMEGKPNEVKIALMAGLMHDHPDNAGYILDAFKATPAFANVPVPQGMAVSAKLGQKISETTIYSKATATLQNAMAQSYFGKPLTDTEKEIQEMEYKVNPSHKAYDAALANDPVFMKQIDDYKAGRQMILSSVMSTVGAMVNSIGGMTGKQQGRYRSKKDAAAAALKAGVDYAEMKDNDRKKLQYQIAIKNVDIANKYGTDVITQAAALDKQLNDLEKEAFKQRVNTITRTVEVFKQAQESWKVRVQGAVDLTKEVRTDINAKENINLEADKATADNKTKASIANARNKTQLAIEKSRRDTAIMKAKVAHANVAYTADSLTLAKRYNFSQNDSNLMSAWSGTVGVGGQLMAAMQTQIPQNVFASLAPQANNYAQLISDKAQNYLETNHLFYESKEESEKLYKNLFTLLSTGHEVDLDFVESLSVGDPKKIEYLLGSNTITLDPKLEKLRAETVRTIANKRGSNINKTFAILQNLEENYRAALAREKDPAKRRAIFDALKSVRNSYAKDHSAQGEYIARMAVPIVAQSSAKRAYNGVLRDEQIPGNYKTPDEIKADK